MSGIVTPPPAPRPRELKPPSGYERLKRRLNTVWRSWPVHDVFVPFLATRVMLALVGWLALQSFENLPAMPGAWELKANGQGGPASPHLSRTSLPLLNIWSRWDAGWHQSLAKNGYHFVPGRQSNTAFFPAYAMLIRAAHCFAPAETEASWFLCGVIVSNLALLVALYYFVLLIRLDFDEGTAARAVLYLLVFPTTFFFSAVYSESVFLAAAIAGFYYARTNRWVAASMLAAVATLTRAPGILLFLVFLTEYLAQRRFRWREVRINIAALALIPAALGAQMLYFHLRFGNVMAVKDAQMAWGGEWGRLVWPWQPVIRLLQQPWMFNDVMNFSATAVFLVLTVLAAVRLRASYGVYAVSCYCFITAWGTLESMPRYVLMIFPAFILLAGLGRNPLFDRLYLCIASALAAFLMARFSLWRWVA